MNIHVSDKFMVKAKKVGSIFMCSLIAFSLFSCSGAASNSPLAQTNKPTNIDIDVKDLAMEIFEVGEYSDELTPLEDDMFDVVFQTVDITMLTAKSAYAGSGGSAEQIVVAEAKDEESAKQVKDALNQKLKDDIDMNEGYLPTEVNKLNNPVLVQSGKYIILCVSNDNDKIEQVLLKKGIMS